jgi:hypothetical protein
MLFPAVHESGPGPLCRHCWSTSGRNADIAESTRLTQLGQGQQLGLFSTGAYYAGNCRINSLWPWVQKLGQATINPRWRAAMQRIEDWLKKLGMSEYSRRFTENDIDTSVLRHLTDQDLKELGVSLGHRRKMLAAIAELASAVSPQPALTEPKPRDTAERRRRTLQRWGIEPVPAARGCRVATKLLDARHRQIFLFPFLTAQFWRHFDHIAMHLLSQDFGGGFSVDSVCHLRDGPGFAIQRTFEPPLRATSGLTENYRAVTAST